MEGYRLKLRQFYRAGYLKTKRSSKSGFRFLVVVFSFSLLILSLLIGISLGQLGQLEIRSIWAVPRASAALPQYLPLSARLMTQDYENVPNGSYSIRFRIYDTSSGGNTLWEETQSIEVIRGVFSVSLGTSTSLSTINFSSSALYLGIKVGNDNEMTPRKQILATASAFVAQSIQRGSGLPSSTVGAGELFFNTANNLLYASNGSSFSVVGGDLAQVTSLGSSTTSAITTGGLTSSGSLSVSGTSTLNSTLTVVGAATLQSSLTVSGDVTLGSLSISSLSGNIIPGTSATYSLGSPTRTFANAYIDNLVVGTSSSSGTTGASFSINDDAPGDETSALRFYRGGALTAGQLQWDADQDRFNLNMPLNITGAIQGSAGLTLSGAISGVTSLSASGAINGLTISSGAISGATTLSLSGALSGATTGEFSTSLSTPTLTTASGDLTLDPVGNVILQGSTSDNTTAALNVKNSAGTSLLYVRNDGNVGIGTTAPGAILTTATGAKTSGNNLVARFGTADASQPLALDIYAMGAGTSGGRYITIIPTEVDLGSNGFGISSNNSLTSPTMFLTTSGNVGIGTTGPKAKLEVSGNGASTVATGVSPNSITRVYAPNTNAVLDVGTLSDSPYSFWMQVGDNTGGAVYPLVLNPSGGNVGIGTTAPTSLLSVGSTSQFQVNSSGAIAAVVGITNSGGYTQSGTSANTFTGTPTFSNATYSALFTGGNVGIGTTGPLASLDVAGTGIRLGGVTRTSWPTGSQWTTSGTSVYYNEGNVGIGTTGPATLLALRKAGISTIEGGAANDSTLLISKTGDGVGASALEFNFGDTVSSLGSRIVSNIVSGGGADLYFQTGTGSAGTYTSKMVIKRDGSIGIGTANPGAPLNIHQASATARQLLLSNVSGTTGAYNSIVFQYSETDDSYQSEIRSYTVLGGTHGAALTFHTDDTSAVLRERMRINQSGNVGIGTVGPTSKLGLLGNLAVGATYGTLAAPTSGAIIEGNVGIGTTGPNSKLQIAGPIATAVVSKVAADSPYTVTASDSTILADATNGAITINLPTAVGITGRQYTIKKTDSSANAVTVDGNAAETIDASATYSLATQWKYVTVQSDGSNWVIIANN